MSIEAAKPMMVEQMVYLFSKSVVTLVPLSVGGAILFAFFQFAGEQA
ncbi:hypothetical protein [Haladaptatus sp. NG-WS-4]